RQPTSPARRLSSTAVRCFPNPSWRWKECPRDRPSGIDRPNKGRQIIREVMDVPDVLDDPRAGAAEFNALLPTDVYLRDILRMSTWRSRPAGNPRQSPACRWHGERGRSPGKGGRSCPIPALFHLHDHHFDGDDRIVDE